MIGFFLKLPLATRYAYGFAFVFISGLVMGFGAQASSSDYKELWMMITVAAAVHWLATVVYLRWERRWYRFFVFVFSILATGSYIELSMRVWGEA